MSNRDESNHPQDGKTDAGAEGAVGINSVSGQERGRQGASQKGSEPLEETEEVHKSGYGGDGGSPKTSSDQRERSG